jgi:predicted acetyltransferase
MAFPGLRRWSFKPAKANTWPISCKARQTMSNLFTRPVQAEEFLEALFQLNQYSLHPSPPFQSKDEWTAIVRERKGVTCHAVFEAETPVSVAASTAMTQNLRGQLFPASGVWGVSTHPSARRKGYCRQAIASLLAAERESGKVFSNLYPFRESFYERLGYAAFPLTKIAKFPTLDLSPLLKMETGGDIELQLIGPAYKTYREYLSEMRNSQHGMAFFDFGDQASANRNNLWMAFAQFDGKIEGLMMYRIQGEEVTKFNFAAYRFYYQTSRARYLLLKWIARHIDQTDRAELWLLADEYPETWLADLQVKVESAIRPAMSRVLDVEKLGGMSVGAGSFSARILDLLCPWNVGNWRFEGCGGKLEVSKASAAECELSIQGLSALIAGTRAPQDFPLRGWGNPDPALQTIMRAMFPTQMPFMHENF